MKTKAQICNCFDIPGLTSVKILLIILLMIAKINSAHYINVQVLIYLLGLPNVVSIYHLLKFIFVITRANIIWNLSY